MKSLMSVHRSAQPQIPPRRPPPAAAPAGARRRSRPPPADAREPLARPHQNVLQVVGFAVDILAHDDDALAVLVAFVVDSLDQAQASEHSVWSRDWRRNTMGDDHISPITILSSSLSHSSIGPRWKLIVASEIETHT